MAGRAWTPEEDALLRLFYGDENEPLSEFVAVLKRPLGSIYQHAALLGLRRPGWRRMTAADEAEIRRLHGEGLTDQDIAARLDGGWCRSGVSRARRTMGLPVNAAAVLEARRRGVRTQHERLGIRHGGDLRRLAFQSYAAENGWPQDLRPRAVQMLNALARHGPLDRPRLAAVIGVPWRGSRKSLKGNGPGGSYLAQLLAAGLVVYVHRAVSGRGKGGRVPGLYLLTAKAISHLEANHVGAKPDPEPEGGAGKDAAPDGRRGAGHRGLQPGRGAGGR